jgi:hypothetical protein
MCPPTLAGTPIFTPHSLDLVLGGMSSTTFKKPTIKGDSAARAILGVFESWRSKIISARIKLSTEFAGIAAAEPNEKPVNFKYQLKFDEEEIESGDAFLYVLSPSKSATSIIPICFDDPIETVKKLSHHFQRPTPKTNLVTNNLQEEI